MDFSMLAIEHKISVEVSKLLQGTVFACVKCKTVAVNSVGRVVEELTKPTELRRLVLWTKN